VTRGRKDKGKAREIHRGHSSSSCTQPPIVVLGPVSPTDLLVPSEDKLALLDLVSASGKVPGHHRMTTPDYRNDSPLYSPSMPVLELLSWCFGSSTTSWWRREW
jgi:hypothetical protein